MSTNKRRKAMADNGYQGIVDLMRTMMGEGGRFYVRDPSIGGLKILNNADRGAWIDQFVAGITFGILGDTSDDTVIFEDKESGKRITAGDLHGGDQVVKDMFQDYIDSIAKKRPK